MKRENKGRTIRRALPVLALLASVMLSPLQGAGQSAPKASAAGEQFFIISSIDLKKNQVVLKRPTEVTELMQVTPETLCQNEQGKKIQLNELRAGDTVFIVSRQEGHGIPIALRIRMGYMTYSDVQKRYLQFQD
jgi:hypothetical protein